MVNGNIMFLRYSFVSLIKGGPIQVVLANPWMANGDRDPNDFYHVLRRKTFWRENTPPPQTHTRSYTPSITHPLPNHDNAAAEPQDKAILGFLLF